MMMGSTAAEFDQLPPALRKKVSTETVSPSHSFLVLPYDLGKNPELVPIYPNETPNRCNVAASCRAVVESHQWAKSGVFGRCAVACEKHGSLRRSTSDSKTSSCT
jgi:hypothetical protein